MLITLGVVVVVVIVALAAGSYGLGRVASRSKAEVATPAAPAGVSNPTPAPSASLAAQAEEAARVASEAAAASATAVAPKAKAKPTPAKPAPAQPPATTKSASSGIVVIDAGHQAHGDSGLEPIGPGASEKKPKVADGTSGTYAPHAESAVNLQVALRLQKALEARGVRVIMVRTTQDVNIANSARAEIANKAHAALFIRLHCDGIGNGSTHGLSTLVPARNRWTAPIVSESTKAGKLVHRAALAATGAADRGVVNRGDLSGFNWSKVPTVLVEMGFMSNAAEDRLLTTPAYQQKLADGMAAGIIDYLATK